MVHFIQCDLLYGDQPWTELFNVGNNVSDQYMAFLSTAIHL